MRTEASGSLTLRVSPSSNPGYREPSREADLLFLGPRRTRAMNGNEASLTLFSLSNPGARERGPIMTWSMWVAVGVVVIGLAGLGTCFWDILRKPPHSRR